MLKEKTLRRIGTLGCSRDIWDAEDRTWNSPHNIFLRLRDFQKLKMGNWKKLEMKIKRYKY